MTPTIGSIVLFTSGLGTTDLDPIDPSTGVAFAGSTGAVNPATGRRFDASVNNPATGQGQRFDADTGFPSGQLQANPATRDPSVSSAVNPATGQPIQVGTNPGGSAPFATDASARAVARAKVATKASAAPADQFPDGRTPIDPATGASFPPSAINPATGKRFDADPSFAGGRDQFPSGPFPINPATGQPFRDADINPATNQRFDAAGPINASLPSSNLNPLTGKVFPGSNVNPVNLNPATGQPFTGSDVNPATGQRFDVGVPNPVITPVTSQPVVRGPFNTGPAPAPFAAPQSRFTLPPEVVPAIITAVNQDGTVALCVFYRGRTTFMDSVAHALIPGAPNGLPPSGEWQPAAGSPGALGMWQWPPK